MPNGQDHYFEMPDEVSHGGVRGALSTGEKFVPLTTLLYHIADAAATLGRSDRIHFFAMLCGGAPKVETDAIVDVRFELEGTQLVANVNAAPLITQVRINVVLGEQDEVVNR